MVTTSAPPTLKVEVRDLTVRYGSKTALDGVSFDVRAHEPSGGTSTARFVVPHLFSSADVG